MFPVAVAMKYLFNETPLSLVQIMKKYGFMYWDKGIYLQYEALAVTLKVLSTILLSIFY